MSLVWRTFPGQSVFLPQDPPCCTTHRKACGGGGVQGQVLHPPPHWLPHADVSRHCRQTTALFHSPLWAAEPPAEGCIGNRQGQSLCVGLGPATACRHRPPQLEEGWSWKAGVGPSALLHSQNMNPPDITRGVVQRGDTQTIAKRNLIKSLATARDGSPSCRRH